MLYYIIRRRGKNDLNRKWPFIFFITLLSGIGLWYGAQMFLKLEPASSNQAATLLPTNPPEATLSTQPIKSESPPPTLEPIAAHTDAQAEETHTEETLQQLVELKLSELTLKEKIGQLLIVGIEDQGKSISKATKQLIHEQGIGSIILFKRNISSTQQLQALVKELKQLPAHGIPLWVTLDQEGGRVNRLPDSFPAASELAALNDAALTEASGSLMGEALADLSIDVNFAPVLDINNNPDNPVIGSRAFGDTADEVVEHGMAMMRGLSDHVITVGKHFPGHGDTSSDSHYELPIINKSWSELEQLELVPFRAAIEQDIDAIMIGHLYLPQIDERYPASLSPTIINEYLRKELGFEGIVMTDDLVMGGITEHYEIGEAAVLALQAGNTMLIVGHQPKQQQAVIEALVGAVEQHVLDEVLIDEAVELVLRMKLNT